jgi:hypothetical protein
MIPLISVAAFRRVLTLGSQWEFRWSAMLRAAPTGPLVATISPWQFRQVVHVQTNSVAFAKAPDPKVVELARRRPHANASWLSFPKAAACSFPQPGVIRISNGDAQHWLEYRPLLAGSSPSPLTQESLVP